MAKKWIKGAIKARGSLRRYFKVKAGKKIPAKKLTATIRRLRKKARGAKKLPAGELKLLRRALLARTLRRLPRR